MLVKKIDVKKVLIFFLFSHLIIWTLVPSISNKNLPLDTIEALAWATNLEWGYSKHPPFSAWSVEFFYRIFGNQDWVYYFLSQLFVLSTFFIIYKFSEDFFKKKIYSLVSLLLLEGIYFYNFTTPEFNVNICQLPFWALAVYFCWEGIKKNISINWLIFGFVAALGVLSKYLFIYLLLAIDVFFVYLLINKKLNYKCFISLITFLLVLLPHIFWLIENDFVTITYALHRTDIEGSNLSSHFIEPFIFLGKQFGILIPFFALFFFLIKKIKKIKINFKDKKLMYLLCINVIPIVLMFLTSLFMGVKIRTMWMTPFYLFFGVLLVYLFQNRIDLNKFRNFLSFFLILFIFSPALYFYISITKTDKRTDYPGKEISKFVQKEWEKNFTNSIALIGGDEWHGGNLSYHIKSRPKWDNILESKKNTLEINKDDGFVLIGDINILEKICKGLFFKIKKQGICMIGNKR